MANRPLNFNDPSGHEPKSGAGACYDSIAGICVGTKVFKEDWKKIITKTFGVTMSDDDKDWDIKNLQLVYSSLQNIDGALGGNLNSLVGGATFKLSEYHGDGEYSGWTTHDKTITFYTRGTAAIRQMNIYHEFGHLIDSLPGPLFDVFTNALKAQNNPSFVGSNGYLNDNALISRRITNDPNYASVQAIQASNNTHSEQWADIFANYVAGNIDMSQPAGPRMDMYNFVTDSLAPYTANP